jgi:homoserine dehydrogenase
VNVLLGSVITPHHVQRTGIRDVTGLDARDAMGRNKRIRLVASASRQGGKVKARVEPEMLDHQDPLAGLVDLNNALYLTTDLLGEIGIVQRGGSLTHTAYALLSDVARISQRLKEL